MNKSPKTRSPSVLPLYFISVSFLGLFLLAALTFGIPTSKVDFFWQKPAIGSIFGLICLLGIVAGVYPTKCLRMLHFRKKTQSKNEFDADENSIGESVVPFEGHHPSCGNFSAHVLQVGDKKYCSGCTGLVIGAIISFLGTALYFFSGLSVGELASLFFWLGFLGVAFGLLQYNLFGAHGSFVHLSLNVVFVLGAFLLLIGIEAITSSLIAELYFITLTLYWILTRILLSQREHRKICAACGLQSCRFLE